MPPCSSSGPGRVVFTRSQLPAGGTVEWNGKFDGKPFLVRGATVFLGLGALDRAGNICDAEAPAGVVRVRYVDTRAPS